MEYEVFKEAIKISDTQKILADAISCLEQLDATQTESRLLNCIKSLKETNPNVFNNLENFFYEQIGILVEKINRL